MGAVGARVAHRISRFSASLSRSNSITRNFWEGSPGSRSAGLRTVHLDGVIFGSFTTAFIGLLYYFMPKLCGTPLYKVEWGWWLLWLWNAFLVLGSLSLMMGYMVGVEYAEYEWPLNVLRYVVFVGVAIQVLGTIFRRRAPLFYVSLWYTLAAAIWTLLNLVIGQRPASLRPDRGGQ